MTHVALTCSRLGFTLGADVWSRPGTLVDPEQLVRLLEPLGRTLARGPKGQWLRLEVGDSTEAVLAWSALKAARGDETDVQSIVASAAATELIFSDGSAPSSVAAGVLRDLFVEPNPEWIADGHAGAPQPSFANGCAAARHFTRLLKHEVPHAIATHDLPAAPLVLWSVTDGEIVTVDRDPFVIGRMPECDLQIDKDNVSRRHFAFERSNDGWRVRDLPTSTSGTFVNGQRVDAIDLAPGMVVQLAYPNAWVVLAVQPAR